MLLMEGLVPKLVPVLMFSFKSDLRLLSYGFLLCLDEN